MSAPKSQTKILAKNGKVEVQYETNFDAAQYYIYELSRAALRDVGKFVTKLFRTAYYQHFDRHTGNAGKATKYKVIAGQSTQKPRLQIGLKTGAVPGFYAFFQELGTSRQEKLGLLSSAVNDNVAEIVKIESQYLSGLSEEASRLEALVDEADMEGDADD